MGKQAKSGWVSGATAMAACLCLCACASGPAPTLATGGDLAPSLDRLSFDVSRLRLAPLAPRHIEPDKGLSPTDLAILAVLNSPDLTAKRAAAKVSAAQAFAAGLLPDPQLGVTADLPVPGSGAVTAYGLSPNLDLTALITHATALKAARATAAQADLDLLWAEWNTAQQARVLAVTILANEDRLPVLATLRQGLADREAASARAFANGDLAGGLFSADLAARLDAESQSRSARRDAAKARDDLNALIGLTPGISLNLRPGHAQSLDAPHFNAALGALPQRRPDLLALQAGYRAQSAAVRKAILSRFPVVNLGFSHQSDNAGVKSNGLSGSLVIPLFNRGRGEVAVQSATQAQLAAEYQVRLDHTLADAAVAYHQRSQNQEALTVLENRLPPLITLAKSAHAAADRRDTDSAAMLAMDQAALRTQLTLIDARLALTLADISLATVLFVPSDPSLDPGPAS